MLRIGFTCALTLLLSNAISVAQGTNRAVVPILTGQVVDQESRPIEAEIHVIQVSRDFRAWSYRTDVDGWFEAGGWTDTPAEVRITANGYTSERLKIDAPATWPPLVVRLKRQATVIGAVRDLLGLGVADATVTIREEPPKSNFFIQTSDHYVLTDNLGRFAVAVPADRPFKLEVEKVGCKTVDTAYMTLTEGEQRSLAIASIDCR